MSNFLIIRKDLNLDPVEIESAGLTVGRLTGNDLVLNHPTVSRTHAGIKEISGDYWVFNLSEANGTLLNGELIDRTPLADGDLLQIGPFFLYPRYTGGALRLEVEMSVNPLPVEAAGGDQPSKPVEDGKTIRLDLARLAQLQREKRSPSGTSRLPGITGMLTGRLAPGDEQALKVFWEKRKREAGKLAVDSPFKPRSRRRLGKAQFNWAPTRDLQFPWPRGLFVWGALLVTILALGAVFAYMDAFSPGALSNAHARADLTIDPAIAKNANSASCSTCHSLKAPINQNCAACHTTAAFHSDVSEKHILSGLTCTSCHTEHEGRDFRPALVADLACTGCHRDGSNVRSPLTGQLLKTPHGGTFGYPVTNGRWDWGLISQAEWERKELPGSTSQFNRKEQFHLVHLAGRQTGRSLCTDCHTAGFDGDNLVKGVRESCARCHLSNATQTLAMASYTRFVPGGKNRTQPDRGAGPVPLCVSCHAQHGEDKELRSSLRRMQK